MLESYSFADLLHETWGILKCTAWWVRGLSGPPNHFHVSKLWFSRVFQKFCMMKQWVDYLEEQKFSWLQVVLTCGFKQTWGLNFSLTKKLLALKPKLGRPGQYSLHDRLGIGWWAFGMRAKDAGRYIKLSSIMIHSVWWDQTSCRCSDAAVKFGTPTPTEERPWFILKTLSGLQLDISGARWCLDKNWIRSFDMRGLSWCGWAVRIKSPSTG